jgi:hypothetical protein
VGTIAVIQGLHCLEHIAQVWQRTALGRSSPRGLFGAVFDFEWMHFWFNVALVGLLVLVVALLRLDRPEWRARWPVGWWALGGALAVELGLHLPEHGARLYQHLAHGWDPAPGILGRTPVLGEGPFDLVALHGVYNAAVTVLLVVAFAGFCLPRRPRTLRRPRWGRAAPAWLALAPVLALLAVTCDGMSDRSEPEVVPSQRRILSGAPQCLPDGTELTIRARRLEYLTSANVGSVACLAAPAETPFEISFANEDPGVRHNIHILRGSRMYAANAPTLFRGELFEGPATEVYRLEQGLSPGMWSFHCDLHPDTMNGVMVVPVALSGEGFSPDLVSLPQGRSLPFFVPSGEGEAHAVKDVSGVFSGNLDARELQPGEGAFFRFDAAGSYRVEDPATSAEAVVQVPMLVVPDRGNQGSEFMLMWAFDRNPAGWVSDVQVRRPGSASWEELFVDATEGGAGFVPDAGPGRYAFRARLRREDVDATSEWSPVVTIAVD